MSIKTSEKQRINYSNNLGTNVREGSLGEDSPPPEESAFGTGNAIELHERPWVLPKTKTEAIAVGTPYKMVSRFSETAQSPSYIPPRSRMIPKMISPVIVITLMELNGECGQRRK